MKSRNLLADLNRLTQVLYGANLCADSNHPSELRNGRRTDIGWGTQNSFPAIAGADFGTLDEYQFYIEARNYSYLLFDGSLLQISYQFYRDKLKKHRLCYYPCPYDLDPEIFPGDGGLGTLSIVEYVEELRDSTSFSTELHLRTPIRFDYDTAKACAGHSASHVHLNTPHFRMPLGCALSVGHFANFVFSNFYRRQWEVSKDLREFGVRDLGLEDTFLSKGQMYLTSVR